MTCKICKTNKIDYYGGICNQCITAYQAGEKAERKRLANEVEKKLQELKMWLEQLKC